MRPRLLSFELAWTDAAFDAIFPEPEHLSRPPERGLARYPAPPASMPHGIKQLHPARFFDAMLADVPLEQSMGLRVALWIVALAPLFTIRKLATIGTLSLEDRSRVLERLLASPIYVVRQLAASFKAMAAMLYAQSPAIRAAMSAPGGKKGSVVALRVKRADEQPKVAVGGGSDHAAE